jgi:putative membrane protein
MSSSDTGRGVFGLRLMRWRRERKHTADDDRRPIAPATPPAFKPVNSVQIPRARPGFPWGGLFWSALGGLATLALGLWAVRLVEDLTARVPWLGWVALVLACLAALAFVVIAAREVFGLLRVATMEKLRTRAGAAVAASDKSAALAVVRDLIAFEREKPQLVFGEHASATELLQIAERELLARRDDTARALVARAARRVSVVTAVSPRALVDLAFVFISALVMVRRLAEIYGGRPGALGLIKLMRQVIAHLVVTGGLAAGDSLIQQLLGHGVAAKLSARLGEGVLNGLLTARLGLAAIDVVRPLPFVALSRPALSDIAGDLLRRRAEAEPQ